MDIKQIEYRNRWHFEDEAQYKQPNRLQRAAAAIASVVSGPTVNPYSTFALGKDFSHWDGPITAEMVKGLDFVVGKIGGSENDPHSSLGNPYTDETFANNCQVAYDAGVPFMGYWFVGARVWIENAWTKSMVYTKPNESHPVMQSILPQLHAGNGWKAVSEFWLDWEDASDWTTYPGGIPAPWHTFYMDDLRARIAGLPRKMPLVVYSRKSYVDRIEATDRDLNFSTWMSNRPEIGICAASWPRRIPNTATAAEVRANYLPAATWKPYTFGYSPAREKTWQYWQFSGDPDWIIYNGTPAELHARLGFTPRPTDPGDQPTDPGNPPPPVPTKQQLTITAQLVNVRMAPDTSDDENIITQWGTGKTADVAEVITDKAGNTWAKVSLTAYVAVKNKGKTYSRIDSVKA